MAIGLAIPPPNVPLSHGGTRSVSLPWYRFFSDVESLAASSSVNAGGGGILLGGFLRNVDLNRAGDNSVTIASPTANYLIDECLVQATQGAHGASKFGLFSLPNQSGVAWSGLVNSLLANPSPDQANGVQAIAMTGSRNAFSADGVVYFNVGTPQGAYSLANVYVYIRPLP